MLRFAPPAIRPLGFVRPPRATRDVRCSASEYEGLSRRLWTLLQCESLDAAAASRVRGIYFHQRSGGIRVVVHTPRFWGEAWDTETARAAAIRSTVTDAGVVFTWSQDAGLAVASRHEWPDDLVTMFVAARPCKNEM